MYTPQYFSEAFKIQVVREFEQSKVSQRELSRKYGIRGHSTLLGWLRKYGKSPQQYKKEPKRISSVMSKENDEMLLLRNQIKALQQELDDARLKNVVLETMIDIADRDLGTNLRKKCGPKHAQK